MSRVAQTTGIASPSVILSCERSELRRMDGRGPSPFEGPLRGHLRVTGNERRRVQMQNNCASVFRVWQCRSFSHWRLYLISRSRFGWPVDRRNNGVKMVPVDCKADEEAGSHARIPNSKRTPNKNSAANMPSECTCTRW
jgi:hypothetical protein